MTPTVNTIQIQDRYDVAPLPEEPGVMQVLDTKRSAAHWGQVKVLGERRRLVEVKNLDNGHQYRLVKFGRFGTWACQCQAAKKGYGCWHKAAAEVAVTSAH